MITRSSGILMHITSLPSPYGIGTFGKEAYEFVDFLVKAGQKYWQILPLEPTGDGNSPYQALSAFAGNPYFIDFDLLTEEGLLKKDDYNNIDFGTNDKKLDYKKIFDNKMLILRTAFENSKGKYTEQIKSFRYENKDWLGDYALYMAVKSKFGLKSWQQWDKNIKLRRKESLNYYKRQLKEEVNYWEFLQYLFFNQWIKLKRYANVNGIKIIGDVPIYVAEDSSDTWAKSEIFLLDNEKRPTVISGCPPDSFAKTGQLWGNPIYNWEYLANDGYKWWMERVKRNVNLYDVIRIDHFRGFESFWQIPYGEETAINGRWVKGPGIKFFNALKRELGEIEVIAEDLGYLTSEVVDLRLATGYPGMKVLEFAFDAGGENDYLPHNYHRNCVVYTGTHDNEPIIGWFENNNEKDTNLAKSYLGLNSAEGYNWGFIRGVLGSVANLAIVQLQDYLGLGNEARMNTPSTIYGNWQWRVKREVLTEELANKINNIIKLYGR